ncbi:MAG TPA: hypothetical protein VJL34_04655 [Anaerolineales bacterium]|nr:hypothetical protein [Anaerolineales bacterium]
MEQQRVLLVCSQHLLGESIESILRAAEGVELIGPWSLGEAICQRIAEVRPNVVVIAGDDLPDQAASLTLAIIEQFPEVSVIRTGMAENVLRVFSTHTLPARVTNLLNAIRQLASLTPSVDKPAPNGSE